MDRASCLTKHRWAFPPDFTTVPIQVGMQRDPWKTVVASTLLCRARGNQVRNVLEAVLTQFPTPELMCRAENLAEILRPCGLHNNRARQLQRFSCKWLGSWEQLSDIVQGHYVLDSVRLFCFGLPITSTDHVLRSYAEAQAVRGSAGY